MTAELLFELGCEEIPAEDLFVLTEVLKARASESFEQHRLVWSNLETFATPRRLVLRADVERMQKDLREQKLGPPVKIAYDSDGRATPAGLGFAKNVGVSFEKLQKIETPRGEYVRAEIVIKGKRTQDVLKEVLPAIISSLPFRKYMRWGAGDYQFGRPIRNLLFLYNGKIVPLELAGVTSNRYTRGHLFLRRLKKISVSSFEDYKRNLLQNGVILSFADRLTKISQELREHSAILGATLKEDPELLRLMANEVEYPEVLTGRFSEDFLKLPQEILINAMRKHQKYFCALDAEGRILPVFFAVLNTKAHGSDLIRDGHQRVLQARLRDAEFFWHEDLKTSLADRRGQLSRLTY
ncbi:MAG TPA: glycine--tRNA ligase subunit beta, partial [Acidobacteriota bacterium]